METMVRRAPTSSCTASPNLGQERRSMARLLRRALASLRVRVVVVILTLEETKFTIMIFFPYMGIGVLLSGVLIVLHVLLK